MPGKPAPENLVGEGAELPQAARRVRGAGFEASDPSPGLASLAHPLPQGERGRRRALRAGKRCNRCPADCIISASVCDRCVRDPRACDVSAAVASPRRCARPARGGPCGR
jgi:hypothetical protein